MFDTAIRLLFIGNSLTAANDLPAMIEAMGKASGITIQATAVAKPNFSLEDHWHDGAARRAIERGPWSFVILQQGPSALPESRVLLNEYVRRFDREIRRRKARTGIYMVWPSAARRADFDGVSASYAGAADLVGGLLMPGGDAWRAAWRRDPSLALYGPDGFHPSPLGTYLAALVIFHRVTGRLPSLGAVPGFAVRDVDTLRSAVLEQAERRDKIPHMASRLLLVALLSWSGAFTQAPAGESQGTPVARAAFDAGRAAARAGDTATAAAHYRKAIDADPAYVEAHDAFIFATTQAAFAYDAQKRAGDEAARTRAEKDLKALYEGWAKAQPGNPVYEWALSKLAGKDWNAAERHLQRAVAISPAFARPYQDLSLIAELRGDNEQRIAHLKTAADLNPTDAAYFFYYASAMKAVDRDASRRLLQETATRFPATERGAQGLYWAAYETTEVGAKLAIYDRLRKEFPPEKFSWSESGMSDFFDVLIGVDPAKAHALAGDMLTRITAKSEQKAWQGHQAYATALRESAELRAKGDAKAAVQRLEGVKPLRSHMDQAPIAIARAAALEAAGDATGAYAGLSAVVAKTPTDALLAALTATGRALKKSPADVAADLAKLREAGARPAPAFTLPDYPDRKNVSLADYRGKVVLINFWYPSCGPCRGEFPTLQRVLDKYKDRGFEILSLNVLPEEHEFVMPYLTKNRFGFRALETTTDWAQKAYNARAYPTNLLVDGEGRIVFRPGIIRSPSEQRTFELQIEALLKR